MIFLPPVFLCLFALIFFGVWLAEQERPHLALFGSAFLLITLGLLSQVLFLPADIGLNAVVSAVFYVGGALAFSQAVFMRSGKYLSYRLCLLFFLTIIGGTIYYFYIDRNLYYRIYIINLGMGVIFLTAAYQARFLLRGNVGDKLLFWLITALGIHFFPRTILTAEKMKIASVVDFAVSPFWLVLQFTISVAGVAIGLGLLAVTFIDIITELRKERDTDPLTGLPNRRLFTKHVGRMMHDGNQPAKPMSFAMVDVDYFKRYNDIYGHSAGDYALKKVAGAVSSALRQPEDMAARIGGEEFGLFFYDCSTKQAKALLDQVRKHIAELNIQHGNSPVSDHLTVSIGVAELNDDEDFESLFRRADVSLYSSKATGRDQVTAA
jgi:diguanylate cyclase (GGDEF)-like protein